MLSSGAKKMVVNMLLHLCSNTPEKIYRIKLLNIIKS